MNGLKQVLLTVVAVAAVLFAASRLDAGWIYDVEGTFAPSFTNDAAVSFVGEFDFPTDSVTPIVGTLQLTNESLERTFTADMSLNLPRTALQPWDTRLYAGLDDRGDYMTMLLVNYGPDASVGTNLLSENLEGGGGWDGWAVSLSDYPVSSLDVMTAQVNEPAALALMAIGAVVAIGLVRSGKRG